MNYLLYLIIFRAKLCMFKININLITGVYRIVNECQLMSLDSRRGLSLN